MRRLILTIVAIAPLLLAADFWKDKQPADWSDKEVSRMMTNSPWAKQVSVPVSMGAMRESGAGRVGGPGAGGPDGGIAGGVPGAGAVAPEDPAVQGLAPASAAAPKAESVAGLAEE